jgi:hypothetical protein
MAGAAKDLVRRTRIKWLGFGWSLIGKIQHHAQGDILAMLRFGGSKKHFDRS